MVQWWMKGAWIASKIQTIHRWMVRCRGGGHAMELTACVDKATTRRSIDLKFASHDPLLVLGYKRWSMRRIDGPIEGCVFLGRELVKCMAKPRKL